VYPGWAGPLSTRCGHCSSNPFRSLSKKKPAPAKAEAGLYGHRGERGLPAAMPLPSRPISAAVGLERRLGVEALGGRRGVVGLLGGAGGEAERDEAEDEDAAGAFHV
jgi:hypothetical protein